MNDALQGLMREATRLTRTGRLTEATDAIQRALSGGPFASAAGAGVRPNAGHAGSAGSPDPTGWILDGYVTERDPVVVTADRGEAPSPSHGAAGPGATGPRATGPRAGPDTFAEGSHTAAGLTRQYKLYLPPERTAGRAPLIVMLHGCTQGPDDFAAGTAMNARAREGGFLVLYPAQSQDANPSRCWNWFKHTHQQRGRGEPALIASLTRHIVEAHEVDPQRVFVAGLSAGGAMAAVLAATYPDVFAAVGVHSGLPAGVARDLPQALALMNQGEVASGVADGPLSGLSGMSGLAGMPGMPGASGSPGRLGRFGGAPAGPGNGPMGDPPSAASPVPTIAFHGDADRTVHPRNASRVVAAALDSGSGNDPTQPSAGAQGSAGPCVERGQSAGGRRFTRTVHQGAGGTSVAELWVLHGAGHAWSGGDARGSYTDPTGPDATGEMLRFFLEHPMR